jgi:hypothetical protein
VQEVVTVTETKAFTVRLPIEQAEAIEAIAQVEGHSVAEEVRAALADRIAARRKDAEFIARVHKTMQRNQRALERLAE